MRQKVKERPGERVVAEGCHHYWVIEMANGPRSRGVCKYCGEERIFFNSIQALSKVKHETHPLDLPKISEVELDEDSRS